MKEAFEGPLPDCPASPNCVCTQASRAAQQIAPLKFVGCAVDEAIDRVAELLESLPRVKVIERQRNYVHASFRTLVFRFVDDVEFFADGATQLLHFRSASRVGYSDLGANRKRLERLTKQLKNENCFQSVK